MSPNFYTRLREYYLEVAKVLRGEADAASVFPNTSDIGVAREGIYAKFLEQHAPSKCNVFLGGFLFHEDGTESKQLDVIITNDTAPRFDFHNSHGRGKSFAPVEGTLGVASIKSTLNKKELFNALDGIASIPPTNNRLEGLVRPGTQIHDYDDWPYKIIYANNGIKGKTILDYVYTFYTDYPNIPINRRPHLIHVAGKYAIFRVTRLMRWPNGEPEIGIFYMVTSGSDLSAITWALNGLQHNAAASKEILFTYNYIVNKVQMLT
jgi:hypothetical protein